MQHSLIILDFFGCVHPVCISAFGDPRQTQRSEKMLQILTSSLNDKTQASGLESADVIVL